MLEEIIDKIQEESVDISEMNLKIKTELAKVVLAELAKTGAALDGLVLQGGNALHLVYGSPRLSKDLDFSVSESNLDFNAVTNNILDLQSGLSKNNLTILLQKDTPDFKRIRVQFSKENNVFYTSLEIANVSSATQRKELTNYGLVHVEEVSEIFVDKIVASLDRMKSRSSFKYTDAYDIYFLQSSVKSFEPSLLHKKLKDYNIQIAPLDFDNVISYLGDSANTVQFERYLSRCLPKEILSELNVKEVLKTVEETFKYVKQQYIIYESKRSK